MKYSYLNDSDFLLLLDKQQIKEQQLKVEILDWDEYVVKDFTTHMMNGSINLDASSKVRRTASVTFVLEDDQTDYTNVNSNLFSINKKINLEMGIKNNTEYYTEYPIIWFPLGVYIITEASLSRSTSNGITVQLQLKDKMCMLDGEIGGMIEGSVTFSRIKNIDGTYSYPTIYEMIQDIVAQFGSEQKSKIFIRDLDTRARESLSWYYNKALYLKQASDGTYTAVLSSYEVPDEDDDDYDTIKAKFDSEKETKENAGWTCYEKYDSIGYDYMDLVYETGGEGEELTGDPGDSVCDILDKIINKLSSKYEYFYDLDGYFIFQEIRDYNMTGQATMIARDIAALDSSDYFIDETKGKATYVFNDSSLITSYTNQPNYASIKNDFVVWGTRTDDATDVETDVRYHLAIDDKPTCQTHDDLFETFELDDSDVVLNNGKEISSLTSYDMGFEDNLNIPEAYNLISPAPDEACYVGTIKRTNQLEQTIKKISSPYLTFTEDSFKEWDTAVTDEKTCFGVLNGNSKYALSKFSYFNPFCGYEYNFKDSDKKYRRELHTKSSLTKTTDIDGNIKTKGESGREILNAENNLEEIVKEAMSNATYIRMLYTEWDEDEEQNYLRYIIEFVKDNYSSSDFPKTVKVKYGHRWDTITYESVADYYEKTYPSTFGETQFINTAATFIPLTGVLKEYCTLETVENPTYERKFDYNGGYHASCSFSFEGTYLQNVSYSKILKNVKENIENKITNAKKVSQSDYPYTWEYSHYKISSSGDVTVYFKLPYYIQGSLTEISSKSVPSTDLDMTYNPFNKTILNTNYYRFTKNMQYYKTSTKKWTDFSLSKGTTIIGKIKSSDYLPNIGDIGLYLYDKNDNDYYIYNMVTKKYTPLSTTKVMTVINYSDLPSEGTPFDIYYYVKNKGTFYYYNKSSSSYVAINPPVINSALSVGTKSDLPEIGSSIYYFIEDEKSIYHWDSETQTYIKDGKRNKTSLTPTDFRNELYLESLEQEPLSTDPYNYYYLELKNEWPKLYNIVGDSFFEFVLKKPHTCDFFMDIIEPPSKKGELSISNIGRRTLSVKDNDINCVFPPIIPNLIWIKKDSDTAEEDKAKALSEGYTYLEVSTSIYQHTETVTNDDDEEEESKVDNFKRYKTWKSAYDVARSYLAAYTSYNEQISIQCLPIYYLNPNTIIEIQDNLTNINGYYEIKTISIPLDIGNTMTITAARPSEMI